MKAIINFFLRLFSYSGKLKEAREEEKNNRLIKEINEGKINLHSFKEEYFYRAGSLSLEGTELFYEDNSLERLFKELKQTERYTPITFKKVGSGEFIFAVKSFLYNYEVVNLSEETAERNIWGTYFFLFKKNSTSRSYEVYASPFDTPQDKTLRDNFATLVLDLLKK